MAAVALPPGAGPADVDYALEAAALLQAVAGLRSPQALFFSRAVTISGRIPEGLATATALEEFFRTFPWTPGRAAGEHNRAQERSA
jgi:predicted lipid carrier protein YhbT